MPRRRPPARRALWLGALSAAVAVAALASATVTATGDDTSPDYYEGSGVQIRGAHIEGQGIPQIQSITPLELFPYMIVDESLFFGDLRVFSTNSFTVGGNAGLGYRYYSEGLDRVFGISGWYDGDDTRRILFQQFGLSLETYGGPFDVRSNVYFPVGPASRQNSLTLVNGSQHFQGDNVVYDQFRSWYSAFKGFDLSAGIPIPGEFAEEHGIRVYGGGYRFSDNQSNTITGASASIQANLIAGLDAQVQVTYDNVFQTRAFVGVSYTFGALHRSEMKQSTSYGRMGEHINRNYTVVAQAHAQYERLTALDPGTGNPYTFAHVSSGAAPGGNGTVNNPFQTIAAAQVAGRNIIFVHAGSAFTGANASLVLNAGDRILGDGTGAQHFVPIPRFGSLLLPQGTGNLPLLNGAVGDAVVLANNSEFSGFAITNAAGSGIVGSGLQNVRLSNIGIDHPGVDGIQLTNTAGPFSITNVAVAHAGGSGINVQGGSGLIQFLGTTSVSAATGPSVLINNLGSSGGVSFANLSIDHRQGAGLEIDNSAGRVTVTGETAIANEASSTAAALAISNSSGQFNFNQVDVGGAAGAAGGVNLQNNSGSTSFNTLNIHSLNGTALVAHGAGNLSINPAVNNQVSLSQGGTIVAANGAAIDIQNTNLNVNLTSVSSNHAATAGLSLLNTTGFFAVYGNGSAGSGGTIQNAPTGILLQNAGTTGFRWMTLDSNGVGLRAVSVGQLLVGDTAFTNSATFGIDALNVPAFTVANSTFGGNGAANIRSQYNQFGTYAFTMTGNQLTSGAADNVAFNLLSGAEGSTLNFLAQNDSFNNTLAGTAGVRLGWKGILSATVDQSSFAVSGGSNTGLSVTNASTTALSTIALTNSTFLSTGGGDTFLHVVAAGPAQVTAFDNLAQFHATNDTGFEMALSPSSIVNIASNSIVDTQGGATGILFDSITGPGLVTISDNAMNLTNLGAFADRGIIFSSVTGTIQLAGPHNNIIRNAATPFFVPFGSTTGSIKVNGATVP